MTGVVYQLEFPHGKLYIGISTRFKRRMGEHRNGGRTEDGHAVKYAIRKYGWMNVKVSILEHGIESKDVLREREVHWIAEKKSVVQGWGYNLTIGGDAQPMDNPVVKEWHRARVTEAMNREDVREKKRTLWQNAQHKEMMQGARLNYESAEKRRLGFARKREEQVRTLTVDNGKKLMLLVKKRLTRNARNAGRTATPGQLQDALEFWQMEWDVYTRKYWGAPPLASWKSHPSGACASTGGGDRAFLKEMSGDESEEESDGDDSLLGILRDGTVSEEGQSEQGE
tara:strand:- start:251 stop:1099 length:849 start_codon:yes stop_codon:yes gene_type:complete